MRIEIAKETEKLLDKIRGENYIYGKGHTATVRFLVRYYDTHKGLVGVLEKYLAELPKIIEEAFNRSLRNALVNLFKSAEE